MTAARSPHKRHVGHLAREAQRRKVQAQHLLRQAAVAEMARNRAAAALAQAEDALTAARIAAGLDAPAATNSN